LVRIEILREMFFSILNKQAKRAVIKKIPNQFYVNISHSVDTDGFSFL